MTERLNNCQRQSGMDCRGCDVAVDVATNVLTNPKSPVAELILEVTDRSCPEGTQFLLHGDLRELTVVSEKIIQLRSVNGELKTNRKVFAAEAAGL